jgi:hypothetical protein
MKTNAEIVERFEYEFKNKASHSRRRPAAPGLAQVAPREGTRP